MSDLQITLIALGAVIILCVLLYNWWQERKFRLDMASSFIEPKHDALINDFEINADAFEENELVHNLHPRLEPNTDSLDSQLNPPDFNELVFDENTNEAAANTLNTRPATTADTVVIKTGSVHPATAGVGRMTESDRLNETLSQDWSDSQEFIEPNFIEPSFLDNNLEQVAIKPAADAVNVAKVLEIDAMQPKSIVLPVAVDIKIDLAAVLYLEKDLAKVKLNYALNDFVDLVMEFDKPVCVYGLNADDTWGLIKTDSASALNKSYSQLVCSLQLVDRSGAVNRATLNRFQHAVELLGLELGSQVEWLGEDEPLNFAQQLDQFCIDVDKIIGFHLVQGDSGAFHGTKLRGLAEAKGFSLGSDGAFHYREPHNSTNGQIIESNVPLFSIIHQNNQQLTVESLRNIVIKGVTFQMDIPRVKNCAEVFNQMVTIAQKMQQGLAAHLVDDHQKPLTELQIAKICQQLEAIHTEMLTYGIAPGSPTALRLFS